MNGAARAILNQPLAISDAGLQRILGIVSSVEESTATAAAKAFADAQQLEGARNVEMRDNGVAVLSIDGPLMKRDSFWSFLFGGSSYESIKSDLEILGNDDSVRFVVIDCDSPGGDAHGAGETSAAIAELAKKKPVVVYVSGTCASAAYWLASAATKIVTDPSAILGSIGVKTLLVDSSKLDEKMGVVEYDIVSSQSPYKVVDAADASDRGRVQRLMTDICSTFVAQVAEQRGVTEAKVLKDFGRGDVLCGQFAVDAGLADAIGDLESVIAGFSGISTSLTGAKAMKKPSATHGEAKCDGCSRAMDDDDETFCRACHTESASFSREVMALIGASDLASARGLIAAMKQSHAEVATLRAEAERKKAEGIAAEFDALVAQLGKDKKMSPAAENNPVRDFVMALKKDAEGVKTLKAFSAALPPLVGAEAVAPVPVAPVIPISRAIDPASLSDDDKKMLASLGRPLEELQKAQGASPVKFKPAPLAASIADEEVR